MNEHNDGGPDQEKPNPPFDLRSHKNFSYLPKAAIRGTSHSADVYILRDADVPLAVARFEIEKVKKHSEYLAKLLQRISVQRSHSEAHSIARYINNSVENGMSPDEAIENALHLIVGHFSV